MLKIKIKPNSTVSKVAQIVHAIAMDIEKGTLPKDFQLPSINEFNEQFGVARDTIEKAYKELKVQGYVQAFPGRGYFVNGKKTHKIKILLVFNKLSSYKKSIYEGFLQPLEGKATVDLQIHHYDPKTLGEILDKHLGHYHHYVVMPHFSPATNKKEWLQQIQRIPIHQLLILDKNLPGKAKNYMAVFQDFKRDIYEALQSALQLLKKYNRVVMIFPTYSNHPTEIIDGLKQFAADNSKEFLVVATAENEALVAGTVYIVIAESDLAQLVKKVKSSSYKLGKEVGIISFNETILKDLLDITVISTDFEQMGRSAAEMILNGKTEQIKNPFRFIKRSSV